MTVTGKAWLALAVPPIAWFVFEQGLSALLHARCTLAWLGIGWGVISLAACGAAVRIAWPLRRPGSELAGAWIARLALAVAAIFGLAILFQTLAILIVPACVR
jgi:hypothetical protein